MIGAFQPLRFQDHRQEQRFRVFLAVKRWRVDVLCTLIPVVLFWCFQGLRYFRLRTCSCSPDGAACANNRSQNDWLAEFPCGNSIQGQLRWYMTHLFQAHCLHWMKEEFLEAGCIQLLNFAFALVPLCFNKWYTRSGRYRCVVSLRLLQKMGNLLGVLISIDTQVPSFSSIHYGSNTMYGATVLLWYMLLVSVTVADSLPLLLLEWGALASIVLFRSWAVLTVKLAAEVLLTQLLVGILIPLPLLYALESSQRKEFCCLEAAHLDPVASTMHKAPVPAGKALSVQQVAEAAAVQQASKAAAMGVETALPCAQHSAAGTSTSSASEPSSCGNSIDCPTALLQGMGSGRMKQVLDPPNSTADAPSMLDSAAVLSPTPLMLVGPAAGGVTAPRRRRGHTLYVPKTSLRLVSVKIHKPPPDLVADPAPLHAAVCSVLTTELPDPALLCARHTTITGCLHLFLWVQDQPFAPPAAALPPASTPCDLAPQQQLEANILQAVQQLCCSSASTPGHNIVVSTYGQLTTAPQLPSPTPNQLPAPRTPPAKPATHLPPELAWSGIPQAAPMQAARMPSGCWVLDGRVTLPCAGDPQPQPDGDELVVALLPGSLEEAAVRRAGGAARVVLVEAASGQVLLDRVLPASPQGLADGDTSAHVQQPLCLRLPLASLSPLPAGVCAHLVVVPDKDRTGHVLCSLQLIAAPAVAGKELQGLFSDIALDLNAAPTSPTSAQCSPAVSPTARGNCSHWLRAQCEAYNEHMAGLVCDMLSLTAPAAPLAAPRASAGVDPLAEGGALEVASGIHQYLLQEGMVASADFFLNCLESAGSDLLRHLDPTRGAAPAAAGACGCTEEHAMDWLVPARQATSPSTAQTSFGVCSADDADTQCLDSCCKPACAAVGLAADASAAAGSSSPAMASTSKGGLKASSQQQSPRWRWALLSLDLSIGALQLAVAARKVACATEQQLYLAGVLLYYCLVLGLYVAALGPCWHRLRRHQLLVLPLLLRLAAALPYVLGVLPGQDAAAPAGSRLLKVLLTNTGMHMLHLRASGLAATAPSQAC